MWWASSKWECILEVVGGMVLGCFEWAFLSIEVSVSGLLRLLWTYTNSLELCEAYVFNGVISGGFLY